MDLEATVNMLMPLATGQGARGEWKRQDVIFDLPGEFSRKLCVEFWGDKAVDAAGLRPGDRVTISINLESREYNGRWYTSVRAWRMTRLDSAGAGAQDAGAYPPPFPPEQPAPSYEAPAQTSAAEVDDLPF